MLEKIPQYKKKHVKSFVRNHKEWHLKGMLYFFRSPEKHIKLQEFIDRFGILRFSAYEILNDLIKDGLLEHKAETDWNQIPPKDINMYMLNPSLDKKFLKRLKSKLEKIIS